MIDELKITDSHSRPTIETSQLEYEYECPIHGNIGDEWSQRTIRFENGPLHCTLCLRDLLADKLPLVEKRRVGGSDD